MTAAPGGLRLVRVMVVAVAPRPGLWRVALRQWRRSIPDRWWRHRPWLPLPRREYVELRLVTHSPNGNAPTTGDVVDYLTWCRGWH
jgi:hypothetical protein